MHWKTSPPVSGSAIPARMVVLLGLTALLIVGYASWKQSARYDPTRGRSAFPELRELSLPHVVGGAMTMAQGMDKFSGRERSHFDGVQISVLLGSVLVLLVVGPTMLAFAIRRRLLRASPDIPGVMTLLGLATGGSWMLLVIPLAVWQSDIRQTRQDAWRIQHAREELVRDLMDVRIAALQYAALPVSRGGGSGSFEGFHIPEELRVTSYGTLRDSLSGSSLFLQATLDVPLGHVHQPEVGVPFGRVRMALDNTGKAFGWKFEGVFP